MLYHLKAKPVNGLLLFCPGATLTTGNNNGLHSSPLLFISTILAGRFRDRFIVIEIN